MTTQLLAPKESSPVSRDNDNRECLKRSGHGEGGREKQHKTAVLLGNLNVGKTTLFNRLCRKHLKVANYPGTTISIGRGTLTKGGARIHLTDTPGIGGMMPESEDEKISRDILLDEKPDIIALVADGKNLRKSLLLALQLAEFEVPLLIDINMMDEARQRGIQIDTAKLSSCIGAPVTCTTAIEGEGVDAFARAFTTATRPQVTVSYPAKVESAISLISRLLKDVDLPVRAVATALLTGDEGMKRFVATRCGADVLEQFEAVADHAQSAFSRPLSGVILESRLQAADDIVSQVYSVLPPKRVPLAGKIGEWSRRPLTGIPIAALVVFLMYMCVGKLGAGGLSWVFEEKLFNGLILPLARNACAHIPSPIVIEAIVGQFGLVTLGLSLVFSVLPVLAVFFFVFGVLEDSGYLPRLSVLLDRPFRKIGLNGKGVFPLVTGFSCVTMAILTTRVLETKRERFIATLLLVLGIPCAPVLALILVILGSMSIWASVTVFGIIATQIVVLGFIAGKILPGRRSDFILELPPIRIPRLRNLLRQTLYRVWWFAKEALPSFFLAAFVLFLADKVGLLLLLEKAGKPILTTILGLPPESVQIAIMTVIRKYSGAGLIQQLSTAGRLDHVQTVVSVLLLTFLSPCINAIIAMLKERGVKEAVGILAFVVPYALAVGAMVNLVCRTLGVTFK